MGNIKKTLESGARIEIQVASFEKSHRLMQVVKSTGKRQSDILDIIIDPEVQDALWDCMSVCLYNESKITKSTFENDDVRGDYLLVAKEALVANLGPFFKRLASESSGLPSGEIGANQK